MSRDYDDFRRTSCVTRIKDQKDGWYAFEETVFYGEKGGMPSDKGTINGQPVTGLRWDGDTLYHQVEQPLQDPIAMQVDEEERVMNTAIQSALHVLDGYYAKLGRKIIAIGVHPDNQWYEVDDKNLPEGHLDEVQHFMNQVILHSQKVSFHYMKGSEYPDPEYAKYDEVRLVQIGDLNTQPCGTLHVNETSEIQCFAVLYAEKTARGTKIYVACSFAAVNRLRQAALTEQKLCHLLSGTRDTLADSVQNLQETGRKLKKDLEAAHKELAAFQAEKLLADPEPVMVLEHTDAGMLRSISQALMGKTSSLKMLAAAGEGGVSFAIVSPEGNARTLMDAVKQKIEVTGGGSPKIASGQTAAPLEPVVEILKQLH